MGEIGPSWGFGLVGVSAAAKTNKKGPQCQELAFYMTNRSVITHWALGWKNVYASFSNSGY